MDEKLIVVSVVESEKYPMFARVKAWELEHLDYNLSQDRRRYADEWFFPVAAFEADPVVFQDVFKLMKLPASMHLEFAARKFGAAKIIPEAMGPIFKHYGTLPDRGATMFAAWNVAVGLAKST